MDWSAAQYVKFEEERNRPIRDLLAAVPNDAVSTAMDLGCGPGNSTALLRHRFPEARVTGLDSSPAMIEAARQRLPDVAFERGDIAKWETSDRFDVVLANASLQWVPDHRALLPALIEKLAPGGSLAVQMPDNLDEPAHRLMREVAAQGPWAGKLAKAADARAPRNDPHWYYELLSPLVKRVDLWRTAYVHVLEGGAGAIVEWFKSTGLRPFLAPLDPQETDEFLRRYEAAVAEAYPAATNGAVLLPFPRLFFVATH